MVDFDRIRLLLQVQFTINKTKNVLELTHINLDTFVLLSAYQTGVVCGQTTVNGWTVDPLVNIYNGVQGTGGMTAGGVFTAPTAAFYFFSACLLCQEVLTLTSE